MGSIECSGGAGGARLDEAASTRLPGNDDIMLRVQMYFSNSKNT